MVAEAGVVDGVVAIGDTAPLEEAVVAEGVVELAVVAPADADELDDGGEDDVVEDVVVPGAVYICASPETEAATHRKPIMVVRCKYILNIGLSPYGQSVCDRP